MICFSIFVDAPADRINGSHQGKRQGALLFACESHHGVLSGWGAGMEGGVNTPMAALQRRSGLAAEGRGQKHFGLKVHADILMM